VKIFWELKSRKSTAGGLPAYRLRSTRAKQRSRTPLAMRSNLFAKACQTPQPIPSNVTFQTLGGKPGIASEEWSGLNLVEAVERVPKVPRGATPFLDRCRRVLSLPGSTQLSSPTSRPAADLSRSSFPLNRMNRSKPTLSGGRSYMAYPSESRLNPRSPLRLPCPVDDPRRGDQCFLAKRRRILDSPLQRSLVGCIRNSEVRVFLAEDRAGNN
jgi:hypothetical protein